MQHHADARLCEEITREHARTFSLASRLLPPLKRRAAYALYAFCRVADDVVDLADDDTIAAAKRQLDDYQVALLAALDGEPSSPIFRELAWVSRAFRVPRDPLLELLDGVRRDLQPVRFPSWPDLEGYCQGVASSVGEMCTHVFGLAGPGASRADAVRHARTLGVAMQLTNILRDVGEDGRRGRCYLPIDDLAAFGLSPEAVLHDPALERTAAWRGFMIQQVARARRLYAESRPGIALLAPNARRCAAACAFGYEGILGAIERRRYETISGRARVGTLGRVGILGRAWFYRGDAPPPPRPVLRRPVDTPVPRELARPATHAPVLSEVPRA